MGGAVPSHPALVGYRGYRPPPHSGSRRFWCGGFHLPEQLWEGGSCKLLAASLPAAAGEWPAQDGRGSDGPPTAFTANGAFCQLLHPKPCEGHSTP